MVRSQFVRRGVRSETKVPVRPPVRRRAVLVLEGLEPRQMLCGTIMGHEYHLSVWANTTGATSGTSSAAALAAAPALPTTSDVSVAATAPNGMPLLHSLVGAPTAVYLDFDGFGTSTPYDTDGNPAVYGATEQSEITEAWRQVASYFSMFYTDVTTVVPSVPYSYSLISNSQQGVGYSYLQFPTTTPSAFNPSGDARTRQSGLAHEIGHNFSLAHQSDYDLLGNKVNEYSNGYDHLHGPIMGVDYAQDVHKWFIGHNSGSPSLLQDDVAVIAGRIDDYSHNDGFRPDDVANSIGAARALSVDPATGTATASGIIERLADVDFYSFTNNGGQTRIDVATPVPSMLDAKLEVYAGDGTLVAAADSSTTNDQHLTLPVLPAGTYYAAVRSHGGYGDLGPYDLTLRSLPTDWAARDIGAVGQPGYASYSADTGSGAPGFSLTGGGADIGGSADEFHFAYTQLTGDGAITARVLSVENTGARALAGVTIRESLAAGSRNATLGLAPGGSAQFRSRTTTGGSTGQTSAAGSPAPYWVRLVRTGNAVTGFRSPDGSNWTQLGSITLTSGASVYIGLVATAANDTTTADARFESVSIEGNAGLVAPAYSAIASPANLTLAQGTGTGLSARWDAVPGATGYVLERSADGATWATAANLSAAATSFSDVSLPGSLRYFYRVSATDAGGRSAPSAAASALNRPSAVTNLAVTSWTSSQLILNWRDTNGESGYRIERAPEGSDTWTVRATVGANVPSYTDAGLGTDTRWRYRVIPTSPFGDGPSVEALGNTRLPALSGLQVSDKQPNKLTLKWNPVSGATGYRISRSLNGTDYTTLATVSGTTYDDRAVISMREYYYRVVGVNGRTESLDGPNDSAFAATPSPSALPAGWQARDIGTVGGSGATGYVASTGTFTVISSGNDIWNAADAFRFTYQPLVGNGSITARVMVQENTTPFAKAGVMIRESTTPGSRFALMAVTPQNGTAFQWRATTSGQAANNNTTPFVAPFYVRLTRVGNRITGYRSADGITWVQQAFADIPMSSSVLVGLAAVPGDNSTLGTVTFNSVSLSNTPPTVLNRASASPATVAGVSTTVSVLGADDHGEGNLTYTWSVTEQPDGAPDPVFSDNGTNAAKSVAATFSAAGTYTFQVRITDTSGLSVTSGVTVEVGQTATGVTLTPAGPVHLLPGATVQFAAAVVDQFGRPMEDAGAQFTWVADAGTIGDDGLYTAPAEEGTYSVFAVEDGGLNGSADVVVAVPDVTPPTLEGATSLKPHGTGASGGSGPLYGIDLALGTRPSRGTVEPRRGGPTMLRLSFSEPVAAEDGLLDSSEFMVENATFVSATLDAAGSAILLNLSDVTDRSVVTVTVAGLADGAGNELAGEAQFSVRALYGDVSGNGVVNEFDTLQVRRAMARPLSGETFLYDLDLDGSVGVLDLLAARRNSGNDVL